MERDLKAESQVKDFYDSAGWSATGTGASTDAALWEDLREAAAPYVSACRRRILSVIPAQGEKILDAASGPIQYPEYLEYSSGYAKRVCVDISEKALAQAQERLGSRGEYRKASILELPFPDNTFDCSLSLHTIYHIDREQQAGAVRQLLRVTKPGQPLVVIYANPDRIALRIKRWLMGAPKGSPADGIIYYFAHPLAWWRQFSDVSEVEILPWRSLTAKDSRRLIPNNILGRALFAGVFAWEKWAPRWATNWGAYPMIVLTKKRAAYLAEP